MKRGIFLAPFGELADPHRLVELAKRAEDAGWDGFFLWDHIRYAPITEEVADPWVAMAAIAAATERVVTGPLVTPLSRRRIQKLARETVTLDRLARGRFVLGVGLGSDQRGELEPYGDEADPRTRAQLLDDGLDRLRSFWAGEFQPPAEIPVWVAVRWPNKRPLARAARNDGVFPIDLPDPAALATYLDDLRERGIHDHYDVVVTNPPGVDPQPWADAGATWCLTGFGPSPTVRDVLAALGSR